MGIAVNIEPAAGRKIAEAVKIEHKQPTYYNPISTRIQDLDEDNVEQVQEAQEEQVGPATYTAAEAAEFNAQLEGALQAGVALTAEQALAYNTKVIGASKEEGNTLTEEEANAYNASLAGAVKEGDEKPAETPVEP
jgi:hypothetical protein